MPRPHPLAFDDHRLVDKARLILRVTLTHHLRLGELVDSHVGLKDAPGRANGGDTLFDVGGLGPGWWRLH